MLKTLVKVVPALALLLVGCQSNAAAPIPARAAFVTRRVGASVPTEIAIPMYAFPGKVWDEAIAAKVAHPNVPILLIADVTSDGVGNTKIPAYATYIAKAQAAGLSVIGYVATFNGKRSEAAIETQMTRWYGFYRVNGVFLDEMNPNDSALYTAVTAYAHAHALPFVMGNPGTNAAGNAGPDVINYYEQRGYPSLSFLKQKAHLAYGPGRWSYMAGAVPYDAATITATAPYVSYLYATDGSEPECYCKLPSYFTQLVGLLAGLNPN